jgi:hypothetical protein
MRVLRTEKSKGGKLFRMVDDANRNYNYHDIVIEFCRVYSDGCAWLPCSDRFRRIEDATKEFNQMILNK